MTPHSAKKTRASRSSAPPFVAFQGELGAFSFTAANRLLKRVIQPKPCQAFKEVFDKVSSGQVSYGVIPIENTLHGSVHENYDLLLDYDLPIIGETSLRISHQLIAVPGARRKDITKAFSHPVALNQCRLFFEAHPQIQPLSFYDTAGSVKMLMEEQPAGAAAIASEDAAALYGGVILQRNIEDNRQNFTRFFLLSRERLPRPRHSLPWKTSLVFATENRPGALFRAIACFALRDLNLTKLESRPLRSRPWEYRFYVDILGAETDEPVARALAHLQEMTSFFKVLGSYRPTA